MKITAKDNDNDTQKRIKKWMNLYRWNQYQLKKNAELPDSTVRDLFTENRHPRVSTIDALCRAFGITLSVFFSDEEVLPEKGSEVWHIIRMWGQLDNEGKEVIKRMLQYAVKNKSVVSGRKDGYSSSTVDNVHTQLHPAFQMAVRVGLIRINPGAGALGEIKKSCVLRVS